MIWTGLPAVTRVGDMEVDVSDIFSRAGNDFRGSFASDGAKVVFAGANTSGRSFGTDAARGGVGLLTQQLSVQYSQAISRLYEIGTNYTFLVAGRTQGQVQMNRVLGPRPVQGAFYRKYGNVCNAGSNNISFQLESSCDASAVAPQNVESFSIHHAVITNMGFNVAAQDMMINEQVAMMFVSLTQQR